MNPRLLSRLFIVAALCAGLAVAADRSGGYRLAGVMATGRDRIGFLELPEGGQVLIRQGSIVNGGRVVEFSAQRLRIAFPDRTIELELSGASAAARPPLVAQAAAPAPVPPPDTAVPPASQTPMLRPITRDPTAATVRAFRANGIAPAPPGVDERRYAAEQIAPVFGLPENARLVAVNETPVSSAAQAYEAVRAALTMGGVVLQLETPAGLQRLYVNPPRNRP
jgi:hypothetical protein